MYWNICTCYWQHCTNKSFDVLCTYKDRNDEGIEDFKTGSCAYALKKDEGKDLTISCGTIIRIRLMEMSLPSLDLCSQAQG